jgi:hypothetical protein
VALVPLLDVLDHKLKIEPHKLDEISTYLCLLELSISIHALSLVSRAWMNTFPVFAAA